MITQLLRSAPPARRRARRRRRRTEHASRWPAKFTTGTVPAGDRGVCPGRGRGPGGGRWVWRVRSGRPIRDPRTVTICLAASGGRPGPRLRLEGDIERGIADVVSEVGEGRAADLGNDLEDRGMGEAAFISARVSVWLMWPLRATSSRAKRYRAPSLASSGAWPARAAATAPSSASCIRANVEWPPCSSRSRSRCSSQGQRSRARRR